MSRIWRERKFDYVLMLLRDPAHARGRVMPPLLMEEKGLIDEAVGPPVPIFANETLILRQRFDAAFGRSALHYAATGVIGESKSLRIALSRSCSRLPARR